jgi:hypothetical protein
MECRERRGAITTLEWFDRIATNGPLAGDEGARVVAAVIVRPVEGRVLAVASGRRRARSCFDKLSTNGVSRRVRIFGTYLGSE